MSVQNDTNRPIIQCKKESILSDKAGSYTAITSVALGALIISASLLGVIAGHGCLPQHITTALQPLTDRSWLLLGLGATFVGVGALAYRYFKHQIKETEAQDQEYETRCRKLIQQENYQQVQELLLEELNKNSNSVVLYKGGTELTIAGQKKPVKLKSEYTLIASRNDKGTTLTFFRDRLSAMEAVMHFTSQGYALSGLENTKTYSLSKEQAKEDKPLDTETDVLNRRQEQIENIKQEEEDKEVIVLHEWW